MPEDAIVPVPEAAVADQFYFVSNSSSSSAARGRSVGRGQMQGHKFIKEKIIADQQQKSIQEMRQFAVLGNLRRAEAFDRMRQSLMQGLNDERTVQAIRDMSPDSLPSLSPPRAASQQPQPTFEPPSRTRDRTRSPTVIGEADRQLDELIRQHEAKKG